MRAASLAKAGPGFCGRGDFLARRVLGFDFFAGAREFFGGACALFFPEGITAVRLVWFDKGDRFKFFGNAARVGSHGRGIGRYSERKEKAEVGATGRKNGRKAI